MAAQTNLPCVSDDQQGSNFRDDNNAVSRIWACAKIGLRNHVRRFFESAGARLMEGTRNYVRPSP